MKISFFFSSTSYRMSKKRYGSKLDEFERFIFYVMAKFFQRLLIIEITIFSIISSLVICFFFLLAENQTDRRKASKWDIKQHQSKEFGHPVHSCWFPKITSLILAELFLLTTHNEALHFLLQIISTSKNCARLCSSFHSVNKIMVTGCANCLNMEDIF